MLGKIVTKREVLELIGKRTQEDKDTSFQTLVSEFWLSPEAARSHLKRLWRDRLVRSTGYPATYRQGLGPGESIRELEFRLSRRGRERLRWYEAKDEEAKEEGWLP